MKFACSECGARIEATERFFGRDVGCPVCGNMIHCPRPEENAGISTKAVAAPAKNAASSGDCPVDPASKPPETPTRSTLPTAPPIRPPGSVTGSADHSIIERRRTGFGTILLVLLCVAAVGYGMVRYRSYRLPAQVKTFANRVLQTVAATPEPTPVAEIAATPVIGDVSPSAPESAPPASPVPVPSPDTTPALAAGPETSPPSTSALTEMPKPSLPVALTTPPPTATPAPSADAMVAPRKITGYFGSTVAPVQEEETIPQPTVQAAFNNPAQTLDAISARRVILSGVGALRLTGAGDPLPGSVVNFKSPEAWLMLEKMSASTAVASLLPRTFIDGAPAALETNVRVVQYGSGCAVIPQGPDFAAMQVFRGPSLTGASMPLRCGVKYDDTSLGEMKMGIGSFRLKRGYTATVAQEENGTGISKNYVAQDRDIEVTQLTEELDHKIRFVRIFPWRWTSKKGVAGNIYQNLKVGWYYNWNISTQSTPELEYVPIRQNRWWPGLNQDWIARGATHLLGFNEPDHKDQSNLKVDDAIHAWPDLLGTGLRLGSPAVSDGGLGWLYDFMGKADAAHLRVDFVAVHYYRAVGNPGDAQAAASQFYNYLKGIHDRTHRPIWITEWNNGANWTGHKPNYEQEKAAVAAMVQMLDRTPFVERYAVYNWVEDERNVQRKDGTLTPAGEVYRDENSPLSYVQAGQ